MSADGPLFQKPSMSSPSKVMKTEAEVYEAIRKTFAPPAYAVLPGVADGTGRNKRRTIDALVMSLWPSRGLTLAGIEIKVSRSDLMRELKNPAKAETIARYCDHFWIALGDESIVPEADLPATWGLLVPGKGGAMRVAKDAPALEATPIDREFLAGILRRASERFDGNDLRDEIRTSVRAEFEDRLSEANRTATYAGEVERLRERVAMIEDFERASGIHFSKWSKDDQLRAAVIVKSILGSEDRQMVAAARRQAEVLRTLSERLAAHAQSISDALESGDDG